MQSIQAGTTTTFAPDSASPDTLGNGWVVIQQNPDGTDGQEVAIAGSGQNGWSVQSVDSPNLTIIVPLSAVPNVVYRTACAKVTNGSRSGTMYLAKFLVTPAPAPPRNLTGAIV